ncbi:MAG TPA: DNA repair protein RadA, partial [Methylococcaceae bacterium]|nr:DNA repair protein RadA [Methylococcaceae bacterium]
MSSPGKDRKILYRCTECGHAQNKWAGQCGGCGVWNTLVESLEERRPSAAGRFAGYAGDAGQTPKPVSLAEVPAEEIERTSTGLAELDRVLGGGLAPGS